jgi:hypothetical protein
MSVDTLLGLFPTLRLFQLLNERGGDTITKKNFDIEEDRESIGQLAVAVELCLLRIRNRKRLSAVDVGDSAHCAMLLGGFCGAVPGVL